MSLKQFSNYINTHKQNPLGVCIDALEDMIHHFDHPEADGYTAALVGDADVLPNSHGEGASNEASDPGKQEDVMVGACSRDTQKKTPCRYRAVCGP